ncbi:prolyl aminopeptidase [Aromatoleum petrolei]|uniref:Proline iminopeptidase n=1 Tax=Aromatoleum petrolei TaxID=76116 RepID=A0ABX1MM53_9RHOO|nr:prolyl aminopeptidase [Aromatoleum petrolei]NMF87209.1 prolyl aminopeptidase [Aromatoleum petrolei]QTQ38452.1 Proline iminopeptidase [Aromatoleum petrolei]
MATVPDPAIGTLFPPAEPWQSGRLDVGDGHSIYFEQCGDPTGIPLVVLHGGPGSGCSPRMRQIFDPMRFRIVLFDQRGCGRSTPHGECAQNTTADLVADIERLRRHVGVERWLVTGGSWGAALAVAYAAAHQEACLGAILRGIFLTGAADLEWFFAGAGGRFPQAWQALDEVTPGQLHMALRDRLFDAVLGDDEGLSAETVRRWMQWEATLDGGAPAPLPEFPDAATRAVLVAKYRVQAHYLRHQCFLGEEQLLELAASLAGLPVAILHGEKDLVCRVENARRLHRAVPGSRLRVVAHAGHNPFAAEMLHALRDAAMQFAPEPD